jgi:AraC-like DNA-binding protein
VQVIDSAKISTDIVQPKARLRFWREAVCDTFVELECHADQSNEFFGTLTNRALLNIQFSHVRAAAQKVVRTRSKIAQSNHDYYLLSLQTHGRGMVAQDGRTAILKPGDFALYDTTRPYDLTFTETFGQLVLRLPREIVSSRLSDAESLTALPIQGDRGAGRLVSGFIHQLHAQLDELDAESAWRLHASAVDLLATALASQIGTQQPGVRESHILFRRRIRAFIDRQHSDPDLSCELIAARHGISERYLRKLFEGSNESVSEWIWKRRLDQAKRDLVDPLRSHIAITSIGYEVGFKDPAHFSRAFKARFGMTPREFRSGHPSVHLPK